MTRFKFWDTCFGIVAMSRYFRNSLDIEIGEMVEVHIRRITSPVDAQILEGLVPKDFPKIENKVRRLMIDSYMCEEHFQLERLTMSRETIVSQPTIGKPNKYIN